MFKRISNLIKGFLGLFISGMERQNPEALLEVVKEDLRVQISRYNQGLASHAALVERLISQVKKLEAQEKELRAKTTANLRAGNTTVAGEMALQLQSVSTNLAENRTQMEAADKTYKDLTQARNVTIQEAQKKIEELKYAIGDMKVKKATAEMTEMASGMIASMGGSGETLNRLEGMVQEEREKAAGRARVAQDSLDTTSFQMKEAEQTALADQALADFAAKEGLALPANLAASQSTGGVQSDSVSETSGQQAGPISQSQ